MNVPPQLLPALQMLLKEIEDHLTAFESFRADAANPDRLAAASDEQLTKERRMLQQRFHTIRGGAGFLKLTGIQALCEKAERAFKNAADRSSYTALLANDFPQYVDDLRSAHRAVIAEMSNHG